MSKIGNLIAKYHTFMVTKKVCPFCVEAKRIFKEHGVEPHIIEYESTKSSEMEQIMSELSKDYNHSSFPAIFYEDKFIGGCDKLKDFYANKENRAL